MKGNIFMVAAVVNPTAKEFEETGKLSEMVLQPKSIIAVDEKAAAIKVIMDCTELQNINKDRLEVLIRPF
jgi:hypothetical protein